MEIDERTYLKPIIYLGRFFEYPTHAYYIDLLRRNGNLSEVLYKARLSDSESNIDELMQEKSFWNDEPSDGQISERIGRMKLEVAQKKHEEVGKFFATLFNQSLVMMCTVFDVFLVDCVAVITREVPSTLLLLGQNSDVGLKDVVTSRTYEEVFSIAQAKTVQQFDFSGIEDKLKKFEKLGVSRRDLFALSHDFINKYPDPYAFLCSIYQNRNDIVHRNTFKMSTYQDLDRVSEFLSHLIMHWGGLIFMQKFNIATDIQLLAAGKIKLDS